ncbi:MAG: hypothetical protein IPJ81_18075 [Chitinophagaceae bacterium]|nr:hypothetical protein [Chitinophagaceae bacterium]
MNPYLTVPIALPGDEQKGNEDKIVNAKILPSNVIAYHEGFSWGVFLYLTTGQAFCCTWTVDEYEQAIKQYWLQIAKQQIKNSNIVKLR